MYNICYENLAGARDNVNQKKDPKRKKFNNNHGVASARTNFLCSSRNLQPVSKPRKVQLQDERKILETTKYLTLIVCTQSMPQCMHTNANYS